MPNASMLRALSFLAGLAIAACPAVANAQTMPRVTHLADQKAARFMWVGNSFFYYNNGMQDIVQGLMAGMPAADVRPYSATLVAISGAGFSSYTLPAYFALDGVDTRRHIAVLHSVKLWDATLLMDCSSCPIDPESSTEFREYARDYSEIIRKHGAEPVFFMTWAYSDKPEMTAALAEAYTTAGNANGALVIPAGLAFARVAAERPDLPLREPDNRHPTVAGSYLAASTTFAALYGRSPEPSSYDDGLDAATAQYLRAVAWRSAQSYYGTSQDAAR